MTYEEAIIQISFIKNFGYPQDIAMLSKEINGDEHRALKMAIEALEKQIPKRKQKYQGYRCVCGEEVAKNQRYCEYCGQALLDWEEVTE